jgi:hypothetical protein
MYNPHLKARLIKIIDILCKNTVGNTRVTTQVTYVYAKCMA